MSNPKITNAEKTVCSILKNSKVKPHKFNTPYEYEVTTDELENVVVLLLKCNISISIVDIGDKISTIHIFHNMANVKPKVTYLVSNGSNKYGEIFDDSIREDLAENISSSLNNILNVLKFD